MIAIINKEHKHPKGSAAVMIGDYYYKETFENGDIYYYPINITEWELADELSHLLEYYEIVVFIGEVPSHIRKEKILNWINEACGQGRFFF